MLEFERAGRVEPVKVRLAIDDVSLVVGSTSLGMYAGEDTKSRHRNSPISKCELVERVAWSNVDLGDALLTFGGAAYP